jgi:hypothetical protein
VRAARRRNTGVPSEGAVSPSPTERWNLLEYVHFAPLRRSLPFTMFIPTSFSLYLSRRRSPSTEGHRLQYNRQRRRLIHFWRKLCDINRQIDRADKWHPSTTLICTPLPIVQRWECTSGRSVASSSSRSCRCSPWHNRTLSEKRSLYPRIN